MYKKDLILQINEIIDFIRVQNYQFAINIIKNEFSKNIMLYMEQIVNQKQSILNVMEMVLAALEEQDMILVADVLEEGLLPIISGMDVDGQTINIGNYEIEKTSSGDITIKSLFANIYLHSNVNPRNEAKTWVDLCFEPHKKEYVIWGLGLGYHVRELVRQSNGSIQVTIYEEDAELIEYVNEKAVLSDIRESHIQIIHDPLGVKFVEHIGHDNIGLMMHLPSIKKIKNEEIRESMLRFFINWNSYVQFKKDFDINFNKNIENCGQNVDALEDKFKNKELVIVGAGPSVDDNIVFLKESAKKRIILCVSTIYRKLMNEGIRPDYVIIMDSSNRTIKDIEGMDKLDIPLIVDSTAYWEFAERFISEKYIVFQRGFLLAEEKAKKTFHNLYETGGSVVTLALEVGIKLGVKSIYLVGVDLAYTNGISHAEGTKDYHMRDIADLHEVKSVNGGVTYASNSFIDFRIWIEKKLETVENLPVFNTSKTGAYIKGTICI